MRLLFLSHEYPPFPTGGIGSYTASTAKALAARGHDVHVLSCVEGQTTADVSDGAVVVHRRGLRTVPAGRLGQRLATAWSCRDEVDRLGLAFDVIESPDHMAEGLALLRRGRPPLAAYAHDSERLLRRTRLCDLPERSVLRRASLVRVPSRLLADHLTGTGWIDPARLHVTAPAIDLDDWPATDAGGTAPVVLVVGRIDAIKSPEVAVRAAAILRRDVPDLEVRIIGKSLGWRDGGPYVTWLRALAGALEVRCTILPEVDRRDLVPHYAAARVVAIPSRVENLPMVALEAMASGRAVVGTTRSGMADLVRGSGALAAVGSAVTLAAALRPYLVDAGHAAAAGTRARETVGRDHDPVRAATLVEDLYRTLT